MDDYRRIEDVIRFLGEDFQSQPSLPVLAKRVGLSDSHFQRLFLRWAGVTPKEFLQCLTIAHAKRLLDRGKSVLDASLYSGLSGPSRLRDLCVKLEAATPGEINSGGGYCDWAKSDRASLILSLCARRLASGYASPNSIWSSVGLALFRCLWGGF